MFKHSIGWRKLKQGERYVAFLQWQQLKERLAIAAIIIFFIVALFAAGTSDAYVLQVTR